MASGGNLVNQTLGRRVPLAPLDELRCKEENCRDSTYDIVNQINKIIENEKTTGTELREYAFKLKSSNSEFQGLSLDLSGRLTKCGIIAEANDVDINCMMNVVNCVLK